MYMYIVAQLRFELGDGKLSSWINDNDMIKLGMVDTLGAPTDQQNLPGFTAIADSNEVSSS